MGPQALGVFFSLFFFLSVLIDSGAPRLGSVAPTGPFRSTCLLVIDSLGGFDQCNGTPGFDWIMGPHCSSDDGDLVICLIPRKGQFNWHDDALNTAPCNISILK